MSPLLQLTEDQRDCLQEVSNIAMGQAGASLAEFLGVFIQLSVPRIRLVDYHDVAQGLHQLASGRTDVSAVRQGFHASTLSEGLRGEAIVVFSDTSFKELADLMASDEDGSKNSEVELLLDITNILNGACLSGIAEQLGTELDYAPPSLIDHQIPASRIMPQEQTTWTQALLIEIKYSLERRAFACDLLLLMPDDSIRSMIASVDRILESFS